ncbi:DapH/DapD/GlmU-related protein [Psychrosphaera aquimarina]|uniref:DapH/DapD/GlmU-related protein n=1 Tax=Psychrosphaera aquimarina TaxID=2044854 RepID=A0ABU3R4G1_9GAMM|nr:DapH/DapD/GlmU-related protein [Psychrosphaera aquimarina]MDU0114564.1 DapH/DapD/GlmU-related protein [Psychrosphaera aquimarina]
MIIIKRIIKKLLTFLGINLKKIKVYPYKIGNLKHQNARVDSLTPMFVEIGDDFVSAPGSIILSHDASPFMHTGKYRIEKTIIGDKVFLGANSVVLPGVTISNNVIVGAGSVVTKDVPEGVVVAGNPARVMCTIDEYFSKCINKGCLYQAPKEFDNILDDGRPSKESILKFQHDILDQKIAGS